MTGDCLNRLISAERGSRQLTDWEQNALENTIQQNKIQDSPPSPGSIRLPLGVKRVSSHQSN